MARKDTPLVGPGLQRTPAARPARDTSSNLAVNPPVTSPTPDVGANVPAPGEAPTPQPVDMLGQPGSMPVRGDVVHGAVPRPPGPSRPAPLRGSLPLRPASRLGR
jgi:hypothetical protein